MDEISMLIAAALVHPAAASLNNNTTSSAADTVVVAVTQTVFSVESLQSDYEARNYDVKKANGYWQLGRLGPEETEELQAKVRHVKGTITNSALDSKHDCPQACADTAPVHKPLGKQHVRAEKLYLFLFPSCRTWHGSRTVKLTGHVPPVQSSSQQYQVRHCSLLSSGHGSENHTCDSRCTAPCPHFTDVR
jgi:hypothetical protein